jgi:hypothetical protein
MRAARHRAQSQGEDDQIRFEAILDHEEALDLMQHRERDPFLTIPNARAVPGEDSCGMRWLRQTRL